MGKRAATRAQGFTLIELLVVIAIIGLLAGIVVSVLNSVRKKGILAKAEMNLKSLKVALNSYHSDASGYPGRQPTPKDDPEGLFRALFTANVKHGGVNKKNYVDDWPSSQIGMWSGTFQGPGTDYSEPRPEDLDFTQSYRPMVLLDPWGQPYHYVEWDSKKEAVRTFGKVPRVTGQAFALWSNGPDMINNEGDPESDDIASWTEGKR